MKKLFNLLTRPERRRAGLLLGMILVMALLDMLGVASIMPFMAVLANPQMVQTNAVLSTAFQAAGALGITTVQHFLFALGMLVFVLLIVSLAFRALTAYMQLRFAGMCEYSIGRRLIEGYLHQPYSWFLNRHSADLGKNILSEVNMVIGQAIVPAMNLVAQAAVTVLLLLLLVLIDPVLALMAGFVLGAAYGLIFKVTSGLLARIGKDHVHANQARFVAVSEAFGAVKEVKVGGLEQVCIQRFAAPTQTYIRHFATAGAIGLLPRFALEAIAFGGMLLVILYLMAQSSSFASVLPVIALYAFAGYRLMPALQQIYQAITQLRYSTCILDVLHADLMNLQAVCPGHSRQEVLPLRQAITLNDIHYSYPNSPHMTLKGLCLNISAGAIVGLVGATGSGKTTTVDLILGLLEAQRGTLKIDGQIITEHNRRAWQRSIGYVPQQIYLADDTVAANIAFGVEAGDIDAQAVERAAKIAGLHEFVMSELPGQYQALVGERGIRLSGGQRQRIGIARALYHKPQVLILDEATSALHNLGRDLTVIMIAHRLSTVKECDTIFLLSKGRLKAHGRFDDLVERDEQFRSMAG